MGARGICTGRRAVVEHGTTAPHETVAAFLYHPVRKRGEMR